jgi:hypothetical protein
LRGASLPVAVALVAAGVALDACWALVFGAGWRAGAKISTRAITTGAITIGQKPTRALDNGASEALAAAHPHPSDGVAAAETEGVSGLWLMDKPQVARKCGGITQLSGRRAAASSAKNWDIFHNVKQKPLFGIGYRLHFLLAFVFPSRTFLFLFSPPMNIKTILLGCWMALMVGLLALSQQLPAPWQSYCWGAAALGGAIGTAFIFLGRR